MEMGSGRISLPSTRFSIGKEPNERTDGVTTYAKFQYVHDLKNILSESLFERLRSTFLAPIITAALRINGGAKDGVGLGFSAQIVHFLLSRQIKTERCDELWFHMAGQPMRFSLREFCLATGLPTGLRCMEGEGEESDFVWPMIQSKHHTLQNLVDQIKSLPEHDEEGKIRLSMLLIIESVFLMKEGSTRAKFRIENVMIAKRNIKTFGWGKIAFKVLLDTLTCVKDDTLNKRNSKYILKGFPMALHLWFLACVPKVESFFATICNSNHDIFLCERYSKTESPAFSKIVEIESSGFVEVACVLRSGVDIPVVGKKYSDCLDSVIELVGKGYRLTVGDWISQSIDLVKANEASARLLDLNEELKEVKAKAASLEEKISNNYEEDYGTQTKIVEEVITVSMSQEKQSRTEQRHSTPLSQEEEENDHHYTPLSQEAEEENYPNDEIQRKEAAANLLLISICDPNDKVAKDSKDSQVEKSSRRNNPNDVRLMKHQKIDHHHPSDVRLMKRVKIDHHDLLNLSPIFHKPKPEEITCMKSNLKRLSSLPLAEAFEEVITASKILSDHAVDIIIIFLRGEILLKKRNKTYEFLEYNFVSEIAKLSSIESGLESKKTWYLKIMTLYCPYLLEDQHWVGLCIDLKSHKIIVLDCNKKLYKEEKLKQLIGTLAETLPRYFRKWAYNNEMKKAPLKPFKIEIAKSIWQIDNPGLTAITSIVLLHLHSLDKLPLNKYLTHETIRDVSKKFVCDLEKTYNKL